MKRILLAALLLVGLCHVQAQTLKVDKFYKIDKEKTTSESIKLDLNGDVCGLVILKFAKPEAVFEGDTISTEYNNGEWKIYMPQGSNWLNIKTNDYAPLRIDFDDYDIDVESEGAYVLVVTQSAIELSDEQKKEIYQEYERTHGQPTTEVSSKTETKVEETAEDYLGQGDEYYGEEKYGEAAKAYKKAADMGLAKAQLLLGQMYEDGLGVRQDYKEAAKWYKLAAEQGNLQAQLGLGLLYYDGQGVRKDTREAVKWIRMAAEQGDADAQYGLGLMYEAGDGVRQDDREAVKWYKMAAEQGHKEAQLTMGDMYVDGIGVRRDTREAAKWYLMAAEQGVADAQAELAILYLEGDGVNQDFDEALKWLRRAADGGNKNAIEILKEIGDR